MPEQRGGAFVGSVDDAGGGIVTIVVDRDTASYPRPGAEVHVSWKDKPAPNHEHDWRFYARRSDGLADILCVAEGCEPNDRMRVAPMIVSNALLPKYEGQFDAPRLRRV